MSEGTPPEKDDEPVGSLAEELSSSTRTVGSQATVSTMCKIVQTRPSLFPGKRTYSRGCQTSPLVSDKAVQCQIDIPVEIPIEDYLDDDDSDMSEDEQPDPDDPDYEPMDLDDDPDEDREEIINEELHESPPLYDERKFVVFESCLRELFLRCFTCLSSCRVVLRRVLGTSVVIEQQCCNGHHNSWSSQRFVQQMPAGNLLLSAALFFSGCSPSKILYFLRRSNIQTFSISTYNNVQRCYLAPAVHRVWRTEQEKLMQAKKDTQLILGGDARCCSPGHTAKYGSYSIMDLSDSTIIDMQLVQSSEVSSSNAMELEGLKRCFKTTRDNSLNVAGLVTDRHVSVKAYMRDSQPAVNHMFDVWHMAKGIKKKIAAKSKRKDCALLQVWQKSVVNHVYFCAATSGGNQDLALAKWKSILRHVTDVHQGHDPMFTECEHDDLEPREWMREGSKPYLELELIVMSKSLLKDIGKLSPLAQTSGLEAFHSVVTFFAPKNVHFPYPTMEARLLIAVLHSNENTERPQAKTKTGEARWRISYPKARHGEAVVKEVKTPITFNYVNELMKKVLELRNQFPSYRKAHVLVAADCPSAITSKFQKVDKQEAVSKHRSRFNI